MIQKQEMDYINQSVVTHIPDRNFTIQELGEILRSMMEEAPDRTVYCYLAFGFKYAKVFEKQHYKERNLKEMLKNMGLSEVYSKEIGRGRAFAKIVEEGHYGLEFGTSQTGVNASFTKYKCPHTSTIRQIIYYGAPGTGKSNRIRTTFHPDSDYSTFVGAYKPTMKRLPRYNPNSGVQMGEEEKIVYQFVPQAFLKAYVEAWKRKCDGNEEPFYLVIEEINRGNCAQIFGDLFQLLDRDETGRSKYAICPDDDIRRYLQEAFKGCETLDEEIRSGVKMLLPANLYIWATMNTSDQSLFPIDSAFKRRWDWEYMPIEDAGKGHVIEIGAKRYDWWKFISQINDKIGRMTSSEDKKLGYWFVIPANGGTVITAKQLVSKVLFYLWNDVYKDYAESSDSIFKTTDENGVVMDAPFTSFFGKDAEQRLQAFMAYNKIEPVAEEPEV